MSEGVKNYLLNSDQKWLVETYICIREKHEIICLTTLPHPVSKWTLSNFKEQIIWLSLNYIRTSTPSLSGVCGPFVLNFLGCSLMMWIVVGVVRPNSISSLAVEPGNPHSWWASQVIMMHIKMWPREQIKNVFIFHLSKQVMALSFHKSSRSTILE